VKKIVFVGVLNALAWSVFPIGVDTEELKVEEEIEFVNFADTSETRFTPEEVREIGQIMAEELGRGESPARYADKYTAVHIFDEDESGLLGADVIDIAQTAGVRHIDSIRLILSGFLETSYGYARADSALLALFATFYNAIHRQDTLYFSQAYQSRVVGVLDEEKSGLSRHYKDWPGGSQILIPLTDKADRQDIRALSTTMLTEERVVEELQKKEDRGIPERTAMVDLKERGVEQDKEEVETAKEALEKSQEELKAEEEAVESKREELETEMKEQDSRIGEDLAEKQEELAQREETLVERGEALEDEEDRIAAQEEAIRAKEEEIAEDKAAIEKDERILEVLEEPEKAVEELAAREEELKKQEEALKKVAKTEPIVGNRFFYLKRKEYLTDGHYNNDLFVLDPQSGDILFQAAEPNICGSDYWVFEDGIVLITHTGAHQAGHYLSLFDLESLEPLIRGADIIFHRSFVAIRQGFIYAIIKREDNVFSLGKFDMKLDRVAQSAEAIDRNTTFHLFEDQIFVTSPEKNILVLRSEDLSLVRLIDL
jgi:hypothetical protein